MENARGRDLVEAGALCERKNGRGVDPNRNWAVDWGVKEKDYDPSEEFPGRAPHSEPEVQIVLDEARSLKPHVWLNVHSGMLALFTPYDHKAQVRARSWEGRAWAGGTSGCAAGGGTAAGQPGRTAVQHPHAAVQHPRAPRGWLGCVDRAGRTRCLDSLPLACADTDWASWLAVVCACARAGGGAARQAG